MIGKLAIFLALFGYVWCSVGDNSKSFRVCRRACTDLNCLDDENIEFISSKQQPFYLSLLQWTCDEECQYECMWKTVEVFHNSKLRTPQFYGKWPFIRILGIQELASALFSILNLLAHYKYLQVFRREVRTGSPLYWLWHFYAFVNLNAWFWSTVFHSHDTVFTEFMDYTGAFSIIMVSAYVMSYRALYQYTGRFIFVVFSTLLLAFYCNHVLYLLNGRFDYNYNMQLNILIGSTTGFVWFLWCAWNRTNLPHVYYMVYYVLLAAITLMLETWDAEPLFYLLDTHAVWHFSTALIVPFNYWFAIEDCKYLSKQMRN